MMQSFTLMCWNFFGIPLAFVTNIVVTRYMGADRYGDYLYIQKVFDFAFIIFNFGLLRSLNRCILLCRDSEEESREFFGSGLILLIAIYLLITAALYIFAFINPGIKEKGILQIFLCIIPFSLIHYFIQYFEQTLPSSNKINLLIIERYIPRIGFFLFSLLIYFIVMKRDFRWSPVVIVWTSFLSTQLLVYLFVIRKLRPSFKNIKSNIAAILKQNKIYGSQVYIGDLFSTAFTALMPLLLSMFGETNSGVGYYSLSLMLSHPLSFIPVVVATSHYQAFATYTKLPKRLVTVTFAISLFALVCLWILVTPFINLFYTAEYSPVIALTFISSIGTLLYGISDFISRFLMAHGNGKALRNSSFIVGFGTLAMSLALIPIIHEIGAAITHLGAGIIYLLIVVVYYRKQVRANG